MSTNENLNALLAGFDLNELDEDVDDVEETLEVCDADENAILTALLSSQTSQPSSENTPDNQSSNCAAVTNREEVTASKSAPLCPLGPVLESSQQARLLTGETGNGSGTLSTAHHRQSIRPNRPTIDASQLLDKDPVLDPAFGIRVRNPKTTSQMLDTFCCEMKKVRASSIRKVGAQTQGEWATMAVIVGKTECRKSVNDKDYMIWQVSDLSDIQDTPIKVLLFGDCVKKHWKLQVGMTVLLANPIITADNSAKQITLKMAKASQILEIGFCPDFGTCKAVKADGNACSMHVNVSKSDYCVYHMQNAARKLSARRGTFGAQSNVPPKSWRRRTLDAPPPPAAEPTGLTTASRVGPAKKFVKPIPRHMKPTKALAGFSPGGMSKTREVLTPDQLLRNRSGAKRQTNSPPKRGVKSMKEFISSQNSMPNLGSRAKFGFVDLMSPEKKVKSRAELNEQLKIKRAAEILKNSASQATSRKRSVCRDLSNVDTNQSNNKPNTFSDNEILALMNKKSKFDDEVDKALHERQNKYFASREVEEKVESNATSLMEIKNCKVVTCGACDYTSVNQSEYCKSLGHVVRRHTADKRFFRCKNCKTRISCFKLMPTKPCQGCLMLDFERVAMREERKVHEEKLLLRGEECKFLN